ncbi:dTMP kinase [Novimethylophilus kurashikiensis]|uniref:Thymidylate kinase n=1 Tax=Novimethylophilus kurashikiensis TaxID=1825523 RepID=A0A2R5F8P5_9PROT|nr:dTMP kinase [Novimethylophilus kurashikiensis]GBG13041.1 dTMP kinase [Novimethylophilus kurashikiensis]
MARGKFITLEGVDGAGKSTHIPLITELLRAGGRELIVTREPGGTQLAERLREMLLHDAMCAETETLLMFAARREHLAQVILPALERGAWVLSDRFTDASFAYQHGGRGVSASKIETLERWVQESLQPDMTLLFDVPVAVSCQRLAGARDPDRFEQENADFFERIRTAYLERARQFPQRFRIIDAGRTIPEIQETLKALLHGLG